MSKKSDALSFQEALAAMLKRYGLEEKYEEYRLRRDWVQLVGKLVAERTTKLSLQKKTLYITLSSSPLRYELRTRKKDLLARVIEHLGGSCVQHIVIR